ncbi:hypothetical protein GL50803_0035341 [Giardia duodenalis]|uniref:Uncharacterized protein n=1 Tax=Giardia intestinalis (strain ATCC 50803 / WB clone C6) TaxID=184922 RepID=A8BAV7_GIAIC|nr:hypothetical protein GL50803_0035341 [Giardia intestinalis]KAE8302116.1 hypothetical protein GL50803_0035341 [Giardia intestinalis]|eukprot:XP_001708155.1 Hypothetical protein GL50803_35341 [Giardia lamblia ATCC 50803]
MRRSWVLDCLQPHIGTTDKAPDRPDDQPPQPGDANALVYLGSTLDENALYFTHGPCTFYAKIRDIQYRHGRATALVYLSPTLAITTSVPLHQVRAIYDSELYDQLLYQISQANDNSENTKTHGQDAIKAAPTILTDERDRIASFATLYLAPTALSTIVPSSYKPFKLTKRMFASIMQHLPRMLPDREHVLEDIKINYQTAQMVYANRYFYFPSNPMYDLTLMDKIVSKERFRADSIQEQAFELRRKRFKLLQTYLSHELRFLPTYTMSLFLLTSLANLHADLFHQQQPVPSTELLSRFSLCLSCFQQFLVDIADAEERTKHLKIRIDKLEDYHKNMCAAVSLLSGEPYISTVELFVRALLPFGLFLFCVHVTLRLRTYTSSRIMQLLRAEQRLAEEDPDNVLSCSATELIPVDKELSDTDTDTDTSESSLSAAVTSVGTGHPVPDFSRASFSLKSKRREESFATTQRLHSSNALMGASSQALVEMLGVGGDFSPERISKLVDLAQERDKHELLEAIHYALLGARRITVAPLNTPEVYASITRYQQPTLEDQRLPSTEQPSKASFEVSTMPSKPAILGTSIRTSIPTTVPTRKATTMVFKDPQTSHSLSAIYTIAILVYSQTLTRLLDVHGCTDYYLNLVELSKKLSFNPDLLFNRSPDFMQYFSFEPRLRITRPMRLSLLYNLASQSVLFDSSIQTIRAHFQPVEYMRLLLSFFCPYLFYDSTTKKDLQIADFCSHQLQEKRLLKTLEKLANKTYEFVQDFPSLGSPLSVLSQGSNNQASSDTSGQTNDTTDTEVIRIVTASLSDEALAFYTSNRCVFLTDTEDMRRVLATPLARFLISPLEHVVTHFTGITNQISTLSSEFLNFMSSNASVKLLEALKPHTPEEKLGLKDIQQFIIFQETDSITPPDMRCLGDFISKLDQIQAALLSMQPSQSEHETMQLPSVVVDPQPCTDLTGRSQKPIESQSLELGDTMPLKDFAQQSRRQPFETAIHFGPASIAVSIIRDQFLQLVDETKNTIRSRSISVLLNFINYVSSEIHALHTLFFSFMLDPELLRDIDKVKEYLSMSRLKSAFARVFDYIHTIVTQCSSCLSISILDSVSSLVERIFRDFRAMSALANESPPYREGKAALGVLNDQAMQLTQVFAAYYVSPSNRQEQPIYGPDNMPPFYLRPQTDTVIGTRETNYAPVCKQREIKYDTSKVVEFLLVCNETDPSLGDTILSFNFFSSVILLLDIISMTQSTSSDLVHRAFIYSRFIRSTEQHLQTITNHLVNSVAEVLCLTYHSMKAAHDSATEFEQENPYLSTDFNLTMLQFDLSLNSSDIDASSLYVTEAQILEYEREFLLSLALKTALPICTKHHSREELFGKGGGINVAIMGNVDYTFLLKNSQTSGQPSVAAPSTDPSVSASASARGELNKDAQEDSLSYTLADQLSEEAVPSSRALPVSGVDALLASELKLSRTIGTLKRQGLELHKVVPSDSLFTEGMFYRRPIIKKKVKTEFNIIQILAELRFILQEICIIQASIDKWKRFIGQDIHKRQDSVSGVANKHPSKDLHRTYSPYTLLSICHPLCSVVANVSDLVALHEKGVTVAVADYPSSPLLHLLEQTADIIKVIRHRVSNPDQHSFSIPSSNLTILKPSQSSQNRSIEGHNLAAIGTEQDGDAVNSLTSANIMSLASVPLTDKAKRLKGVGPTLKPETKTNDNLIVLTYASWTEYVDYAQEMIVAYALPITIMYFVRSPHLCEHHYKALAELVGCTLPSQTEISTGTVQPTVREPSEASTWTAKDGNLDESTAHIVSTNEIIVSKDQYARAVLSLSVSSFLEAFEKDSDLFSVLLCITNNASIDMEAREQLAVIDDLLHNILMEFSYDMATEVANRTSTAWNSKSFAVIITPVNSEALLRESLYTISNILNSIGHGNKKVQPELSVLHGIHAYIARTSSLRTTRHLPLRYQGYSDIIQQSRYAPDIEVLARYLECGAWLMLYVYKALFRITHIIYALLCVTKYGICISLSKNTRTYTTISTQHGEKLAPFLTDDGLAVTFISQEDLCTFKELFSQWKELAMKYLSKPFTPLFSIIFDRTFNEAVTTLCKRLNRIYDKVISVRDHGILTNLRKINASINPSMEVPLWYEVATSNPQIRSKVCQRVVPLIDDHYHPSSLFFCNTPILYCGEFLIRRNCFKAVQSLHFEVLSGVDGFVLLPQRPPLVDATHSGDIQETNMPLRELTALESSDEVLELLEPIELPKGVFLVSDKIIRNIAPALMKNISKAWEEFNHQIQRYEKILATELNKLRQERMVPDTATKQKTDSVSFKLNSLSKRMQEKVGGQIGSDDSSSSDDTNAIEKSLREQDTSNTTSQPDERSRSDDYKGFLENDPHLIAISESDPDSSNQSATQPQQLTAPQVLHTLTPHDIIGVQIQCCSIFDNFFSNFLFRSTIIVLSSYIRLVYSKEISDAFAGKHTKESMMPLLNLLKNFGKAIEMEVICSHKPTIHKKAIVAKLHEWFDLLTECKRIFMSTKGMQLLSASVHFPFVYFQPGANKIFITSEHGTYSFEASQQWLGAATILDTTLKLNPRQLGLLNKIFSAISERMIIFLVCSSEKGHSNTELYLITTALSRYLFMRVIYCPFSEYTFAANLQRLSSAVANGCLAIVVGIEYLPSWQLLQLCTLANDLRVKQGALPGLVVMDKDTGVARGATMSDFPNLGFIVFFLPELSPISCMEDVFYVDPINTTTTSMDMLLPVLGQTSFTNESNYLANNVTDYYSSSYAASERLDLVVAPFRIRRVISLEIESPDALYLRLSPEYGRAFYEISVFLRQFSGLTYKFVAGDIPMVYTHVKERTDALCMAAVTLDMIMRQTLSFILHPMTNDNLVEVYCRIISSAFGLDKTSTVQLYKLSKAYWDFIKASLFSLNLLHDHSSDGKLGLAMGYNASTAVQSVVHARSTFAKYFSEHLSKYLAPRLLNYVTLFGQMHQLAPQFVIDIIFANELLKSGRPLLAVVPQSSYIRAYTAVLTSVKHWDVSYVTDSRSLRAALKRLTYGDSAMSSESLLEPIPGKVAGEQEKARKSEHLIVVAPPTSHALLRMFDQLFGASLHYPIILDEFGCTYYQFDIGRGPYFMICVTISMLQDFGPLIDLFTHRVVLLPSIEGSDGCRKILHGSLFIDTPHLRFIAKMNVDLWKSELKRRKVESRDALFLLQGLESLMATASKQTTYMTRVIQRIAVLPTFINSIIGFLYDTMAHVFNCGRSVDEVFLIRSMFYFFLLRFNVVTILRKPLPSQFLLKSLEYSQAARGETPQAMKNRVSEIAKHKAYEDGCSPMAFTGTFAFTLVSHVRECVEVLMRLKEALAKQQPGSVIPSLPEPFGMTLDQRAQILTFLDTIGVTIPKEILATTNIYSCSSSSSRLLKKAICGPESSGVKTAQAIAKQALVQKQHMQRLHRAFYSSFTSTSHTILADEVWPFLDVAGFSLQEIQELDDHVKQKSSGTTNLTSIINTALLMNAERDVLQLGMGFCGSLAYELSSSFMLEAVFSPETHAEAFTNLVVPLVIAFWNACSLFVTTYDDGKNKVSKGTTNYARWLGKKYDALTTEFQSIEKLTQAMYCGVSPFVTLLLLEANSPLVHPGLLKHYDTLYRLDLGALNHGLSSEVIISNFRTFSKKVVALLPKEFPVNMSSSTTQNYNPGTIANSCFSYIDFTYGLGQNKKAVSYKKYLCKAEFRLYEIGHGIMKRIHEFRDRTFVEKSIDMITTRLVERKKHNLAVAKRKATEEHAKIIHAKEDALFTKLVTTTASKTQQSAAAQDSSKPLRLIKPANVDFYMSSSDEEELVTDKTLSKDKEQEESDSSESNDTADNLEQAKKAMNLELTKLSKLSRNERTAIDLELHDYDKGESVSVQCSNPTITVFSPHHCAIIVALGCAMLSPITVALIGQRGSGKSRLIDMARLLFRDLLAPDTFLLNDVQTSNSVHAIASSLSSRCLQRNYLTAASSRRKNAYIGKNTSPNTVLEYCDTLCFPSLHFHCSDIDPAASINGHFALLLRDHMLLLDANAEVPHPIYLDMPYDLKTGAISLSDMSIIVECTADHNLTSYCGLQIEVPPCTEAYLNGLCKRIFPHQTDSWISQYVSGYFLVRGSLPNSISETYAVFSNMYQNFVMTMNSLTVVPDKMMLHIREEEESVRADNCIDKEECSPTMIIKYNNDQLLLRASLHSLFSSLRSMAQMDAQFMDAVIERFASLSFLGYLDTDEEYVESVGKAVAQRRAEKLKKAKASKSPRLKASKKEEGSGNRSEQVKKMHPTVLKKSEGPWSDVKLMLISNFAFYPAWEAFIINHGIRLGHKSLASHRFMGMTSMSMKTTPFVKENTLLMASTLNSVLCQVDGIHVNASELIALSYATINAFWFGHFLLLASRLPIYDPYMLSRVFHLYVTIETEKEMNMARFVSMINNFAPRPATSSLSDFYDYDPFHGTRIYLANRAAPYAGKIHIHVQNTIAMRTGKQPTYVDQDVREYLSAICDAETRSWRRLLRKQTASLVISPSATVEEEISQRISFQAKPKVNPNKAAMFPGFSLAAMMCLRPAKYTINIANGTLQSYAEILSQLVALSNCQKFTVSSFGSIYNSSTQQRVLLDAASVIVSSDPLNQYFVDLLHKVNADMREYEFLLLLLMIRTAMALALGIKPEALYPDTVSPLNPSTGLSFKSALETCLPSRTIGTGRAYSLLPPAINEWSGLRGKPHQIIAREKREKAQDFLLPSAHDVTVIAPKSALGRVGAAGISVYQLLTRTLEPLNAAEGIFSSEEMGVICSLVPQSYGLNLTCDRRMLASFLSINLAVIIVDDLPVGPAVYLGSDSSAYVKPQLYSESLRVPVLNSIKSPAIEMINDIETGLESFRMQGVSINEEHMHDMQQLLLGNSNIKAKQEEYKMNLIRYSFADIVSICNISRCTFPNEPPAHIFRKGNNHRTEFLAAFKHTFAAATISIYKFASRFTSVPTVSLMRFTALASQLTNAIYQRIGSFFEYIDILTNALFFYEYLSAPSKTKHKIIEITKLTVPVMVRIVENAVSSVERHTGTTRLVQKGFISRNHNIQTAVAEAVIMRDFLHSLLHLIKREIMVMEAVVQTAHIDALLCSAYMLFSETDRLSEDKCLQCLINGECGDLSPYLQDLLAACQKHTENNSLSPFTVAMVSILNNNGIPVHIHRFDKTMDELLKDPMMISITAETTGKSFFLNHIIRVMAIDFPTYIILKVLNVEWKPTDPARQTLDCVALSDMINSCVHVVPSHLGLSAAYLLEGIHRSKRKRTGYLQALNSSLNGLEDDKSMELIDEISKNIIKLDLLLPPEEFSRELDIAIQKNMQRFSEARDVAPGTEQWYKYKYLILNYGAPNANGANISLLRKLYINRNVNNGNNSVVFSLYPGTDFTTACMRVGMLTQTTLDMFSCSCPCSIIARKEVDTIDLAEYPTENAHKISCILIESIFGENSAGRSSDECTRVGNAAISQLLVGLSLSVKNYLLTFLASCSDMQALRTIASTPAESSHQHSQSLSYCLKQDSPLKSNQEKALTTIFSLGRDIAFSAVGKYALIDTLIKKDIDKPDIDKEINIICLQRTIVDTLGTSIAMKLGRSLSLVAEIMWRYAQVHTPSVILADDNFMPDLHLRIKRAVASYTEMLIKGNAAKPGALTPEQLKAQGLMSMRESYPFIYAMKQNPAAITSFLAACILPYINERVFRLFEPRIAAGVMTSLSIFFIANLNVFEQDLMNKHSTSMERSLGITVIGKNSYPDFIKMISIQQLANCFLVNSRFPLTKIYTRSQIKAITNFEHVTELIPEICSISPRITYAWLVVTVLARYNTIIAESLPWFAQHHSSFVALALTENPFLAIMAFYAQKNPKFEWKGPHAEWLKAQIYQEAAKKHTIINLPPNFLEPSGSVIFAVYCISVALRPHTIAYASNACICFMNSLVGNSSAYLYQNSTSNAYFGATGIVYSQETAAFVARAGSKDSSMGPLSIASTSKLKKQALSAKIAEGFADLVALCSENPEFFVFSEKLLSDGIYSLSELCEVSIKQLAYFKEMASQNIELTSRAPLIVDIIFYDSCVAIEILLEYALNLAQIGLPSVPAPIRFVRDPTLNDLKNSIIVVSVETALLGYTMIDSLTRMLAQKETLYRSDITYPLFVLIPSSLTPHNIFVPGKVGGLDGDPSLQYETAMSISKLIAVAKPNFFYLRSPSTLVGGFTHTICLSIAVVGNIMLKVLGGKTIRSLNKSIHFSISLRGLSLLCLKQAFLFTRDTIAASDYEVVNVIGSCILKALSTAKHQQIDTRNFGQVAMLDSAYFTYNLDLTKSVFDSQYLSKLNEYMSQLLFARHDAIQKVLLTRLVTTEIELYDKTLMRQLKEKMKAKKNDEKIEKEQEESSSYSSDGDETSDMNSMANSAKSSMFDGDSLSEHLSESRSFRSSKSNRYSSSRSSVSGISEALDDFDDSVSQTPSSVSKMSGTSVQSTTLFRMADGGVTFMPEEDNIYNFFLMGVQMTSNNLDPSKPVYVDSIEKSVLGIMQPRRRTVVTVDAPNMIHKKLERYEKHLAVSSADGAVARNIERGGSAEETSSSQKIGTDGHVIKDDSLSLLLELATRNGEAPKKENIKHYLVIPTHVAKMPDLMSIYAQLVQYDTMRHVFFDEQGVTQKDKECLLASLGQQNLNTAYRLIFSSHFLTDTICRFLSIERKSKMVYQISDMKAMPQIFKTYLINLNNYSAIKFGYPGVLLSGDVLLNGLLPSTFSTSALKMITGQYGFGSFMDHWIVSGAVYYKVLGDILNYLRVISSIMTTSPLVRQKVIVLLKKPTTMPRILEDGSIFIDKNTTNPRPVFYILIRNMELLGVSYDPVLDTICDISPEKGQGFSNCFDLYACCTIIDDAMGKKEPSLNKRHMRLPKNIVPVPLKIGGYCAPIVYIPNKTEIPSEEWKSRHPCFVAKVL